MHIDIYTKYNISILLNFCLFTHKYIYIHTLSYIDMCISVICQTLGNMSIGRPVAGADLFREKSIADWLAADVRR
jgi:hypothetical protein